jgi:ABC-type amino acid transport substrate-binding protein
MRIKDMQTTSSRFRIANLSLVIAVLALIVAGWAVVTRPSFQPGQARTGLSDPAAQSPVLTDLANGKLTVGYAGYPPYTQEDPQTGTVSGLSVDLVNEIASQLNIRVVWKKFNWNTMAADMKRGDFDVIADPIFETIPRGREFAFTEPYAYVPTGIGLIKKGGKEYLSFDDLNDPTIKVAVGQGFAEETLLKARAPKAEIIAVQTGNDTAAAANLVLSGRADIAILTLSDANRFLAANPGKLEALWINDPPAYMPAGFALRLGDELGASFLNVAIRNLRYTGAIGALARRYHIEEDFRALKGTQ